MNKKRVEEYLPAAIEAIKECKISSGGKIASTFRGQISSFGAAIYMGSFKAAVAFFAKDDKSTVNRSNLIKALWYITHECDKKEPKDICNKIINTEEPDITELKNAFLDASVALKLAMNTYELVKEKED